MKFYIGIITAALLALTCSCIRNDVPYPVVEIGVLGVEGDGFTVTNADIDPRERTVTLRLDEATDISRVAITKVEISEGGKSNEPLTGTFDMRDPRFVTLSLYQRYEWEFRAVQEISRVFTVEGQIGTSEFDLVNRTARAFVAMDADLKNIHITELKLGPADITTMNPGISELTDFSSVRYVDITYHDFNERWRIYVERTNKSIDIKEYNLWNNTASISAIVTPEQYPDAQVQYRRKGTEEWKATVKGQLDAAGAFIASIEPAWVASTNAAGLSVHTPDTSVGIFAGTTYEYRMVIGQTEGDVYEFEAPAGGVIPDGDMENSALSCFTSDNKNAVSWGSGNNTFATGLCLQGTFAGMQGSYCAKMQATAAAGVLASGNLFTGVFYKDGLTKGVVEFGQPYEWKARPTALKLKYYAANLGKVDIAMHPGAPIGKGDQDKARIFVAIVDWNTRHQVASGTSAPTGVWDPATVTSTGEGKIIAYGSLFIEQPSTGGTMIDTELQLYFYDKTAKPSGQYSLIISAATSAYGDYMVGCKSNTLYVDDFQWVY